MIRNYNAGGRPPRSEERATHRSLERGLHVLESVAAIPGGASLAETARQLDLHRSTTHHLLQALVGMGYLSQDPRTRRYHPTARLARLAGSASGAESLREIALPFLDELARRGGEEAWLAAYRDGAVVVIAKRGRGGAPPAAGDEHPPLHASAVGKTILAWRPESEQAELLEGRVLERFTTNTMDSRAMLDAELRHIRAAGFAIDDEESRDGRRAVAAPVFDGTGQAVAALGVAGPKARMTRQKIKELRGPLGELARLLSERLGWRPGRSG